MKHNKLLYLAVLIVSLTSLSACVKEKSSNPTPQDTSNAPQGTFTGPFRLIRYKAGVYDTLSANIQLQMSLAAGYKVTGDTATLHAGSYGGFIVNPPYGTITFFDKTYPLKTLPTKTHLSGQYNYVYDGTTLKMSANSALDTLSLQYDLTRTGN